MIQNWIQNISLANVRDGHHFDPGPNAMLIQIVDPDTEFPTPKHQFRETHQFRFLDVEENDEVVNESWRCSPEQAHQLVRLLQHALKNCMNVIVHCHAGICRSGAVCEVGIMLGFQDLEVFRIPNTLVKRLMLRALQN